MNPHSVHDVGNGATLLNHCFKTIKLVNHTEKPLLIWYVVLIIYSYVLIKSHKNWLVSGIMSLLVCVGIGSTTRLNNYMSYNYQRYGFKANYFDETCVFLFIYWCIPLVVVSVILIGVIVVELFRKNWGNTIKGIILQWKDRKKTM